MQGEFLRRIDWERPWLQPYRAVGELLVAAGEDWMAACNGLASERHIATSRGFPLRFIAQAELPSRVPYEGHIAETGCVPTRDNLHDFFNALVWLHFPRAKAQLNALQFERLRQDMQGLQYRVANTRGGLRDAATIFDENAALLVARAEQPVEDLRERRWTKLLLSDRLAFRQSWDLVLFGHALMEKLVAPYKAITAHCLALPATGLLLPVEGEGLGQLDAIVAATLSPELSTSSFLPLPVLGVPGWLGGQDIGYYADEKVFRPGKPT